MQQARKTVVFLAALFCSAAFAAAKPAQQQPAFWGEPNEGVQLAIAADPSVIKLGGKLTLHIWGRNLTSQALKFDAHPPVANDSALVITDPQGKEKSVQYWADDTMPMSLPPGETDLGFFDATQQIGEWRFDPKGPPGRQELIPKKIMHGTYRISWKLHHTVSNTIEVEVK